MTPYRSRWKLDQNRPKVTVLMSVYNGEAFLREAVESILNQTFQDFEFLIINDASTDASRDIILSYNDSRIRLIENEINLGLTKSLIKGIDLAKGDYIARMDCDDISLPIRLEKQIAFMEDNVNIGVCGTWAEVFGLSEETWKYPTDHDEIKITLLFHNVIIHSSVIWRKALLEEHGLSYNSNFSKAQDYELWVRCSKLIKLANIPEALIRYRISKQQIGYNYKPEQIALADSIRKTQLRELKIDFTEKQFNLHKAIALFRVESIRSTIYDSLIWLQYLKKMLNCYYKSDISDNILAEKCYDICNSNTTLGLWLWVNYMKYSLKGNNIFLFCKRSGKLFLKCLWRIIFKKTKEVTQ
ncbi:MAG TPA: glycosyltransferase [Selenomonadales bacterium]|nr:glycosyltransferase [Selenomonadales bacterium]